MENRILAYVVLKDHTLGILYQAFESLGKHGLGLSFLRSLITKGGHNWRNDSIPISPLDFEHIRLATPQDFDDFNVLLSQAYRGMVANFPEKLKTVCMVSNDAD